MEPASAEIMKTIALALLTLPFPEARGETSHTSSQEQHAHGLGRRGGRTCRFFAASISIAPALQVDLCQVNRQVAAVQASQSERQRIGNSLTNTLAYSLPVG